MEEGKQAKVGGGASGTSRTHNPSCMVCLHNLSFCLSNFHQMMHYYKHGELDSCSEKWNDLFDCIAPKFRKPPQVEKILVKKGEFSEAREDSASLDKDVDNEEVGAEVADDR